MMQKWMYRWTDVEIDGITKQVRTAVATDRPLPVQFFGSVSSGAPNPAIVNSHKLFCGLEEDIREGDQLLDHTQNRKRPSSLIWESATRIPISGSVK